MTLHACVRPVDRRDGSPAPDRRHPPKKTNIPPKEIRATRLCAGPPGGQRAPPRRHPFARSQRMAIAHSPPWKDAGQLRQRNSPPALPVIRCVGLRPRDGRSTGSTHLDERPLDKRNRGQGTEKGRNALEEGCRQRESGGWSGNENTVCKGVAARGPWSATRSGLITGTFSGFEP